MADAEFIESIKIVADVSQLPAAFQEILQTAVSTNAKILADARATIAEIDAGAGAPGASSGGVASKAVSATGVAGNDVAEQLRQAAKDIGAANIDLKAAAAVAADLRRQTEALLADPALVLPAPLKQGLAASEVSAAAIVERAKIPVGLSGPQTLAASTAALRQEQAAGILGLRAAGLAGNATAEQTTSSVQQLKGNIGRSIAELNTFFKDPKNLPAFKSAAITETNFASAVTRNLQTTDPNAIVARQLKAEEKAAYDSEIRREEIIAAAARRAELEQAGAAQYRLNAAGQPINAQGRFVSQAAYQQDLAGAGAARAVTDFSKPPPNAAVAQIQTAGESAVYKEYERSLISLAKNTLYLSDEFADVRKVVAEDQALYRKRVAVDRQLVNEKLLADKEYIDAEGGQAAAFKRLQAAIEEKTQQLLATPAYIQQAGSGQAIGAENDAAIAAEKARTLTAQNDAALAAQQAAVAAGQDPSKLPRAYSQDLGTAQAEGASIQAQQNQVAKGLLAVDEKYLAATADATLNTEKIDETVRLRVLAEQTGIKAVEGLSASDRKAALVVEERLASEIQRATVAKELLNLDRKTIDVIASRQLSEQLYAKQLRVAQQRLAVEDPTFAQTFQGGSSFQRVQAALSQRQSGSPVDPESKPSLGQFFGQKAATTVGFAASGALLFGGFTLFTQGLKGAEDFQAALVPLQQQLISIGKGGQFGGLQSDLQKISIDTGQKAAALAGISARFLATFGDAKLAAAEVKSVGEISLATGADLQTSALAAQSAYKNFGISAQQLGDIVLNVRNKFGTSAQDTLTYFSQTAPTAAHYGFTASQSALLEGAISSQTPSTAGGADATSTDRLLADLSANATKLIDLNSRFTKQLFNPADLVSGNLQKVLAEVAKNYGSLSVTEQNAFIQEATSSRNKPTLIAFLDAQKTYLAAVNDETSKNGLLNAAAAAQQETLKFKIQQLGAEFAKFIYTLYSGGVGQAIGSLVSGLGAIVKIAETLISVFDKLGPFKDLIVAGTALYGISKLAPVVGSVITAAAGGTGPVGAGLRAVGISAGENSQLTSATQAASIQTEGATSSVLIWKTGVTESVAELRAGMGLSVGTLEAGAGTAAAELAAGGAAGAVGGAAGSVAGLGRTTTTASGLIVPEAVVGSELAAGTGSGGGLLAGAGGLAAAIGPFIALAAIPLINQKLQSIKLPESYTKPSGQATALDTVGGAAKQAFIPGVSIAASIDRVLPFGLPGEKTLFGGIAGQFKHQSPAEKDKADADKATLDAENATLKDIVDSHEVTQKQIDDLSKGLKGTPVQKAAEKLDAISKKYPKIAADVKANINLRIAGGKPTGLSDPLANAAVTEKLISSDSYQQGNADIQDQFAQGQASLAVTLKGIQGNITLVKSEGPSSTAATELKKLYKQEQDDITTQFGSDVTDIQTALADGRTAIGPAIAQLNSKYDQIKSGTVDGVPLTKAEIKSALANIKSAITSSISATVTDLQTALANGDISLSTFEKDIQPLIAELKSHRNLTGAATLQKLGQSIFSTDLLASVDNQVKIAQLLGGKDSGAADIVIQKYTALLKQPIDAKTRSTAAFDILTAEKQKFTDYVGSLTTDAEKLAALNKGYAIPPEVQAILTASQLTDPAGPTLDALKTVSLTLGKQTDDFANSIARIMVQQGVDAKTAAEELIKGQILVDNAVLIAAQETAAALVIALGGSGGHQGETSTISSTQAAVAAAEAKKAADVAALGKVSALAGVTAVAPTIQGDQATKDSLAKSAASTQRTQEKALISARFAYAKALDALNPVQLAKDDVAIADQAIADALAEAPGLQRQADLLNAQAQKISAERSLRDALANVFTAQIDLAEAVANAAGDTVAVAQDELKKANVALFNKASQTNDPTTLEPFKAAVIAKQQAVYDTALAKKEDLIAFNLSVKKISDAQALSMYEGLLANADILHETEKERQDLQKKIFDLKTGLQANLQFNLPTDLKLPTLYEARRFNESGGNYSDNRQITITLNSNTKLDAKAAVNTIVDAINAPARVGIRPHTY